MYRVVVIGDDRRRTLFKSVYSACSSYGSVALWENGEKRDFCILDESEIQTKLENDIVILGEYLSQDMKIPSTKICILDSGNRQAVKLAHSNKLKVLTCSMANYDTLTADSVTDNENIVISLRRDILTIKGEHVEPQDFCLHLGCRIPIYPMLASCGVLMLCGIEVQNGYYF